MLSEDEKNFIRYWEENRTRKRRFFRQLSVGLPLATFFALAMFINIYSGWFTGALMHLRMDKGEGLMILISILSLTVFIVIFSAHHRWDMNEQHYRELIAKRDQP